MPDSQIEGGPTSRLHVVFVPGFGGFDALGQLEYYTGTTRVFRRWLDAQRVEGSSWGQRVVLHYFPNLPTAGVCTRAALLGRFLSKRVRRNEIQSGDRIALIGHSTGGLDIRQMLLQLDAHRNRDQGRLEVRGSEDHVRDEAATAQPLLDRIDRVVFLSVPQRGTNIANWVQAYALARNAVVGLLRFVIDGVDAPGLDLVTSKAGAWLEKLRDSRAVQKLADRSPDLLLALADVSAEAAQRTAPDPLAAALGRGALYDLNLWLSHTHGDFFAIDDLAAAEAPPGGRLERVRRAVDAGTKRAYLELRRAHGARRRDVTDIARASQVERQRELDLWRRENIHVRSYATRAPAPFGTPDEPGELRSFREVVARALQPRAGTDAAFRAVHTACSGGPFRAPPGTTRARRLRDGREVEVASWENDGIVNTASMLWPNGPDTLLVEGDHADIIGHFALLPNDEKTGRRYDAYDIFQSGAGFDEATFRQVWSGIFDFCADVRTQLGAPVASRPRRVPPVSP